MTNLSLYTAINSMPNSLKNEVLLYIQSLLKNKNSKLKKAHPKAGCMKGTFKMADDFNAPLEDFKEYM